MKIIIFIKPEFKHDSFSVGLNGTLACSRSVMKMGWDVAGVY
jgi:hypothetical protein